MFKRFDNKRKVKLFFTFKILSLKIKLEDFNLLKKIIIKL